MITNNEQMQKIAKELESNVLELVKTAGHTTAIHVLNNLNAEINKNLMEQNLLRKNMKTESRKWFVSES